MAGRLDMLRFYLGRLGKAGMLGALLLLGSLVFLVHIVPSREAALGSLVSRNEQAHKVVLAEQARAVRQDIATVQPPLALEAAAALGRLYAAADQAGLELVQGEYRLLEAKDARMRRFQFVLPVYGSYAEVRKFLSLALNNEPALALTSLQMRREAIESTDLDVMLNFTLYLETAP